MKFELSTILTDRCYRIDHLSDRDVEQIRLLMLDFFAAAFAGYKQNSKFADYVENVVLAQGGIGESSILFHETKLPARSAAFMNSLYGHGAELDDGNKNAMGHVGVHIIPSVLALAEAEKKSQNDILRAIACGYEAYIRISSAAQPGMVNRAFHSTGMAGALGCAIACAKILGLDKADMESAMSLACTMSSGLLTYSESQQMIKPINPAKAAETGVFAAKLAQAGIKGPLNCLEGPNGWFKAVTERYNENLLMREEEHLLLHDCYFKLYPSCRHTHCVIEAGINLYKKFSLVEINRINVYIYPNAIRLAGQIKYPKDADETKFSIYYTLACALSYGEYSIEYMNPPRLSKEIMDVISRIELIPDESMENREKSIRGSRIEIELENGNVIEETVLVPKGDPENPLTKEDIVKKLRICARGLAADDHLGRWIPYICDFGGSETINSELVFCKNIRRGL